MSTIGERFLDTCVDQGVQLYGPLDADIAMSEVDHRIHLSRHTGVLAGVIAAAQYLEREPNLELAERPLDTDTFKDMPSRLLAELINKSLGVTQNAEPVMSFRRPAKRERNTCPQLESYWNVTFREMERGREGIPRVQIFTMNDEPVVMRKGRGEPTGLLLRDTAIGRKKVVYPAGSAVDISTRVDRLDYRSGGLTMLSSVPEVFDVSAIRRMSFRRLTPYAVPEDQRREHFGVPQDTHISIDEIRALAQKTAERDDAYRVEDMSLPLYALQAVRSRLRAAYSLSSV